MDSRDFKINKNSSQRELENKILLSTKKKYKKVSSILGQSMQEDDMEAILELIHQKKIIPSVDEDNNYCAKLLT
jgi:Trp operon repressor